jgi:D-tyrosyl-tRNA(Tyr) deacylase
MRVVVQRVTQASVRVDGRVVGQCGPGLLLLVSAAVDDGDSDLAWMANKILNLRIFPDNEDRMNRSLLDVGGDILSISQFTLHGDARKGMRPGFTGAMAPEPARQMWERFNRLLREGGAKSVETGIFGAHMMVSLENDGPVTILLDSKKTF